MCKPTLSRGGESGLEELTLNRNSSQNPCAVPGSGTKDRLGVVLGPTSTQGDLLERSPTICRQSQAAARRELERARWLEGSLSAVPETAAEVGRGVAVLETRAGGDRVLRERAENLRVVRGPPFRLRGPSFAEGRARSPVLVEFGVQIPLGGIALVGLQHSLHLLYVDLVAREELMQDADEVCQGPRLQQLRPFHPVGLRHPPPGRLRRTPAAGWTPDTPRTRDARDPPH